MGSARLRLAVEEHGGGRQMLRYRVLPRFSIYGVWFIALLVVLGFMAGYEGGRTVAVALLVSGALLLFRALHEYFLAASALSETMHHAWETACRTDGETS